MTRPILPSLEQLTQHIRSDLGQIGALDYTPAQILECLTKYVERLDSYKRVTKQFADLIQASPQLAPFVHSVRFRTKDSYHLAEKLVRKCISDKGPKRITAADLFDPKKGITDLGGVRILHLRPEEWKPIHEFLSSSTDLKSFRLVEKQAFVKKGTTGEFLGPALFKLDEVHETEQGKKYTSLHYIFEAWEDEPKQIYIECQLRTLFEEGWAEIDHQLKYPFKVNQLVEGYLDSLNSSIHTANDIVSKLQTLRHIPLFVPWDVELKCERSARRVYCLTPTLSWPASNPDKFINHVEHAFGKFSYYVLEPEDPEAQQNIELVRNRLSQKGLLNDKVSITNMPPDRRIAPIIADVLLLEDALDPSLFSNADLSIIGAPAQADNLPLDEHLDMVIRDKSAVRRLQFTAVQNSRKSGLIHAESR